MPDIVGVMALMRHPFLLGSGLFFGGKHAAFDLQAAFSTSNDCFCPPAQNFQLSAEFACGANMQGFSN